MYWPCIGSCPIGQTLRWSRSIYLTSTNRFAEVVETIASNIKKGLFPANPGTKDNRNGEPQNCEYCDFDRVCPSNRRLLWERKSTNPEIAPYLSLTL